MSRGTHVLASALLVLSLLTQETLATAGDTCPCKPVSGAKCLKPARPLDDDKVEDGADAGRCAKVDCETWECSEDGAIAHCIEKLIKYKLELKAYTEECIVRRPEGKTFLTPYTDEGNQDNKAYRERPTQFAVKFGANEKCWVFHGTTHLLDTEDPQQLTTIGALPLENCKPLKIKCVDTKVRSSDNEKRKFPGPAIMLEFEDGKYVDGVGLSSDPNAALASTNVKAKYLADAYTPERLAKYEGFQPIFADQSQAEKIFADFPAWQEAFIKNDKLSTIPLIVNPSNGFVTNQMSWFIITPPYCTYPYIQPR